MNLSGRLADVVVGFVCVVAVLVACGAVFMIIHSTVYPDPNKGVEVFTLEDGTRCVFVKRGFGGGLSCDWGAKE